MTKLPQGFPELSIMYKTLTKKIYELKQEREFNSDNAKKIDEIIDRYEQERERIRNKFPENFFEN